MNPDDENLDQVEGWLNERREALNPRPGFVRASRRRLLARIQAEPASINDRSAVRRVWRGMATLFNAPAYSMGRGRRFSRSPRLLAVLVLVTAVALIQNTRALALASPTWLPGDQLYPLRAAWENASPALAPSAAVKARTHIELAQQRILEAQALAIEGRYGNIPGAVQDLDTHVSGAVKAIQELAQVDLVQAQQLAGLLQMTLEGQDDLLKLLTEIAPSNARQGLQQAVDIAAAGVEAIQSVSFPGSG